MVQECRDLLNLQSNLGFTALHLAVENGKTDVVQYLIEQGADINLRAGQNYMDVGDSVTPLETALRNEHDKIVDILLVSGASTCGVTTETGLTHLEIQKLVAFSTIPASRAEEKSAREHYLRDVRQRTLTAYQREENKENKPQRVALKKEIDEFTQLEKWIAKLQKVTKKIPGKKNDALIKDLQSIHEYIESAYSLFAQKKTAREAVQYLISSYSQLIESSAALSAKISSTFSFFKTSTFKEKFDSIFREMEKQYPTIVIVGLNNASSVN